MNQSNVTGRDEVAKAPKIIRRSWIVRQGKRQGQLRGLRQRMTYLEKDLFNNQILGLRGKGSGVLKDVYICLGITCSE